MIARLDYFEAPEGSTTVPTHGCRCATSTDDTRCRCEPLAEAFAELGAALSDCIDAVREFSKALSRLERTGQRAAWTTSRPDSGRIMIRPSRPFASSRIYPRNRCRSRPGGKMAARIAGR
jgi:hypothetical protein